jgi:transketolase
MINNFCKVQIYSDIELKMKSARCRLNLLRYIKMANAGHTGGDLSCLDILNVLYSDVLNVSPVNFKDPGRDRYIQSKGHSVEALYVILAESGFFPWQDLETIGRYRSPYVGHPTRQVNGIEFNTGALGHGLPISAELPWQLKKMVRHTGSLPSWETVNWPKDQTGKPPCSLPITNSITW